MVPAGGTPAATGQQEPQPRAQPSLGPPTEPASSCRLAPGKQKSSSRAEGRGSGASVPQRPPETKLQLPESGRTAAPEQPGQQEQSEKTELLTLPLQAVWKARPPRSSSWRGPPGPGPGHDLEGKSHRMEPRPQCTLHGALLGRAAWPGRGGCPAPTAVLAPPQRVACCGPSSSDYA